MLGVSRLKLTGYQSRLGLWAAVLLLAFTGSIGMGCGGSDSDSGTASTVTKETASISPGQGQDNSAEEEITNLMGDFADAFAAKDAEAVCDLMSPQAVKETETDGDAPCEEVVPLGFALVGDEEVERISNPKSIQINGNRATIKYATGDDGYADLVDGKWMVGQ